MTSAARESSDLGGSLLGCRGVRVVEAHLDARPALADLFLRGQSADAHEDGVLQALQDVLGETVHLAGLLEEGVEELARLAWQALAEAGAEGGVFDEGALGEAPQSGLGEELLGVFEVDDDA